KQRERHMPCLLVVRRDEVDLWSTADPPTLLLRMEREDLAVELVALDLHDVEELLTLRLARGDARLAVAGQGRVGARARGHRGAGPGAGALTRVGYPRCSRRARRGPPQPRLRDPARERRESGSSGPRRGAGSGPAWSTDGLRPIGPRNAGEGSAHASHVPLRP